MSKSLTGTALGTGGTPAGEAERGAVWAGGIGAALIGEPGDDPAADPVTGSIAEPGITPDVGTLLDGEVELVRGGGTLLPVEVGALVGEVDALGLDAAGL